MAVADLTTLSALKDRMQWHQVRQRVLAENVANADTPGFKPRDLSVPLARATGQATGPVAVERTSPLHLAASPARAGAEPKGAARWETRPSGNAVNLEDEMMKVAQNQADYQLAASLYQKSLGLLRVAIGRKA